MSRYEYSQVGESITLDGPRPIRLMNDGEILGFTPLKMEVLPAAFTLYTPADPPPQ